MDRADPGECRVQYFTEGFSGFTIYGYTGPAGYGDVVEDDSESQWIVD